MKSSEAPMKSIGLSTDRALRKLYLQLQSIRFHNEMYNKLHWKDYRQFILIPYLFAYLLTVVLFSIAVVFLSCLTSSYLNIIWNVVAALLLIASSSFTTIASIRRLEGHSNVILVEMAKIIEYINYMRSHEFSRIYAPLHLPHSTSYSLQLTYRDGQLVNVPVSLLVEGDIINLRSGQTIYCDCILITEGSVDYSVRYSAGDIFLPRFAGNFTGRNPYPSVHLIDSCHLAVVTSSPAVKQVKNILKRRSSNQKIQIQNTSSFAFFKGSVFSSVITAVVSLFAGIIISTVRVLVHNHWILNTNSMMWVLAVIVFLLVTAISLFVPLIWILTLGMSANHLNQCTGSRVYSRSGTDFLRSVFVQPDSQMEQLLLHLGRISRICFVDKKGIISLPIPTPEKLFFFRERPNRHHKTMRTRSFGPNPTLFTNEFSAHHAPSSNTAGTSVSQIEQRKFLSLGSNDGALMKPRSRRNSIQSSHCFPEILNVSVALDCPYKPRFESPRWSRFLECLKPIGLNLLLNNCQPLIREHYAAFADHLMRITAAGRHQPAKEESLIDKKTVAIMNNCCLCGLAYQMGFRSSALRNYSFAASLGIYKATEKSDKFILRSKSDARGGTEADNLLYFRSQALRIQEAYASVPKDNTNEPLPVPNCFCTVYRESTSCGYHVMSQGSGDLITALCTNFWNGRELLPLMDEERSRMLDFYNLSVSTSYCVAFSYMPLLQSMPLVQNTRLDSKTFNQRRFLVLKLPVNFELRSRLAIRASSPNSIHSLGSLHRQHQKRRVTRKEVLSDASIGTDLTAPSEKIITVERKSGPVNGLPRVAFSCGSLPRLSCQTSRSSNSESEFSVDSAALQDVFTKQTFLGMVSLQYQPMPGIVETIRKLNQACIRFVHFSQDNQLRSRVFAERLGLEADWNCHISLADPPSEASRSTSRGSHLVSRPTTVTSDTASNGPDHELRASFNLSDAAIFKQPYSLSSPSVTNLGVFCKKSSTVAQSSTPQTSVSSMPLIDDNGADFTPTESAWIGFDVDNGATRDIKVAPRAVHEISSASSFDINPVDDGVGNKSAISEDSVFNSPSSSSTSTSSLKTNFDGVSDEEDAYNYVFANKSRLPCGIRNIRSHLENVDNVPLKVSLFTDCTPSAVDEMICVMQEYGETVCVVGSSLSIANAELFCRGDTAIALFPLLPLVCGRESEGIKANSVSVEPTGPLLSLAGRLISLGAALVSHASLVELDIFQLVTQAHASVNNIHLCIVFAIASSFASALFYLLSLALLPAFPVRFSVDQPSPDGLVWLPPILLSLDEPIGFPHSELVGHIDVGGRVLWLVGIVIPCLSISIFGRMVERNQPLHHPPVKQNETFSKERILRLVWVTVARFLPSVVVCWLVGLAQTIIVCPTGINYQLVCLMSNNSTSLPQSTGHTDVLLDVVLSQEIPFFLLVLYFVFISFSYANEGQWIHRWRLKTNLPWFISAMIIVLVHLIYLTTKLIWRGKVFTTEQQYRLLITLVCGLLWCPILILVNETINWKERLLVNAEDRFAKLFFDTKLGMYSPV